MATWNPSPAGPEALIKLTQALIRARQVEALKQLQIAKGQIRGMTADPAVEAALTSLTAGVRNHPKVAAVRKAPVVLKHLTVSSTRRSKF